MPLATAAMNVATIAAAALTPAALATAATTSCCRHDCFCHCCRRATCPRNLSCGRWQVLATDEELSQLGACDHHEAPHPDHPHDQRAWPADWSSGALHMRYICVTYA